MRIDTIASGLYDSPAMPTSLPERVDVQRAVAAGREFVGRFSLEYCKRLAGMLVDTSGEVNYRLVFGRAVTGTPKARIEADVALPLLCQSTLERYLHPVSVRSDLGFIWREDDESSLPAGLEPALVTDDGIDPLALIEDELILAVPVLPRRPGAPAVEASFAPVEDKPNPFAALASMKKKPA